MTDKNRALKNRAAKFIAEAHEEELLDFFMESFDRDVLYKLQNVADAAITADREYQEMMKGEQE